ncbi:MAG: uroporphyrin-III C/tetrapyrrole (Corrin/Porphyrin) methyltransferase, rRNA [Candidatus Parcubacteria bacterium]|jgi:16S rRNA (cytidine1402-2'-O)-methyltransferase
MGKLYVIATPIGNLEDMTIRAIRVLKEVDLVLCEDTRETGKLLKHFEIDKHSEDGKSGLMSYHAQSQLTKIEVIIDLLREGKQIALVSDAGTPTISDPGSLLVQKIRESLPECGVITVPGASALTAAFSISGITGGEFTFIGFLPHKKGRETLFKEMAAAERPYVFYESPHRILKALESLKEFAPAKKVFVGRELTKMFEQSVAGTAEEVLEYFNQHEDKVRGEFVVIVY